MHIYSFKTFQKIFNLLMKQEIYDMLELELGDDMIDELVKSYLL
jgi:hypothetical protein